MNDYISLMCIVVISCDPHWPLTLPDTAVYGRLKSDVRELSPKSFSIFSQRPALSDLVT